MLAKRIIPCLDVKDGKTVKGVNFVNFRNAGDPVALGAAYGRAGADELVYLDITASHEGRKTFTDLVKRIAENINIPFTVGGGIHELGDVERLLAAGADKVSVNSAAIRRPALIREIAANYGSQVCVVAIDATYISPAYVIKLNAFILCDQYSVTAFRGKLDFFIICAESCFMERKAIRKSIFEYHVSFHCCYLRACVLFMYPL